MDIFEQLNSMGMKQEHFNQKTEWLIKGFIPKNLISFIWAKGGQGKSLILLGITKYTLYHQLMETVTYIDVDNPISILKDRKIDEILTDQYPNLNYIQRSRLKLSGLELLHLLNDSAIGSTYKNSLFVIDSLRNIVDVMNESQVMKVMTYIMNIREAGGTVIIIGHSNKDGKSYKGSINIIDSVDCMFHLQKTSDRRGNIDYTLKVGKERAGVEDSAFRLHIDTFTLQPLEYKSASMSDYDKTFTKKVLEVLTDQEGINKSELLELVGHKKDDKTARETLDRYDGELWVSKKHSNVFTYSLKTNN